MWLSHTRPRLPAPLPARWRATSAPTFLVAPLTNLLHSQRGRFARRTAACHSPSPTSSVLRFLRGFVILAVGLSSSALAQSPKVSLVGTWRVVDFCDVTATGDTTYSLGRNPIGYFIYDPAGNLTIQAMRTPVAGACAKDSAPLSGMAELRNSYFGYFGTYSITSDTTVIHHVTGGTIPSYIGTDQRRIYRIRADTLSIGGSSPPSCRRLIRVKASPEANALANSAAADRAALVQAAERFLTVFDNLDWEPFAAAWAASPSVFFPFADTPERVEGAAVATRFQKFFKEMRATRSGPPYLRLNPQELRAEVMGSTGLVTFMLGRSPGGVGRRTLVFIRQDGQWKLAHMHASNAAAAP